MACVGQVDVEVSPTYYGASEEVLLLENAEAAVSHASAVEIALDSERNTVFAVSWIDGPPLRMLVRLYDYQSHSFTTPAPITLPYSPRRRVWVARAGYDPSCEVTGLTKSSCAWFSWTAWGNVNWVAVDRDGQTSIASWPGFDGTGDIGAVGETRRQLRAWISSDRSQVLAQLYQGATPVSELFILDTVQGAFAAYQTAVAWSERHQRWLVTWAENNVPKVMNGKIRARWVAFDGSLGLLTQHVAYCEGNPYDDSHCGIPFAPARASSGIWKPDAGIDLDGGQRVSGCVCKGLFLAAAGEQYVTDPDVDAFRVHHYGWQARLARDGIPEDIYCELSNGCSHDLALGCTVYLSAGPPPSDAKGRGHRRLSDGETGRRIHRDRLSSDGRPQRHCGGERSSVHLPPGPSHRHQRERKPGDESVVREQPSLAAVNHLGCRPGKLPVTRTHAAWSVMLVVLLQPGCSSRGIQPDISGGIGDLAVDRASPVDQRPVPLPPSEGLDLLLVAPNDNPHGAAAGGSLTIRLVKQLLASTPLEPRAVRLGMVFNQTETYPGQPPAAHPGELVTSQRGTLFTGEQLDDWWEHTLNGPLAESGTDTYFEASKWALDGRNAGFPRPKALLVVVLFATTEDCTIAKPELMFDDSLWPTSFYYPHVRCTQPLPGMLRDPADYVDALLASHEQRIFVAVVASREKPVLGMVKSTGYHDVHPKVHCSLVYTPSRRVAAFADAITARDHGRIAAGLLTYTEQTEPCVTSRAPELAAQIKAFAFADLP